MRLYTRHRVYLFHQYIKMKSVHTATTSDTAGSAALPPPPAPPLKVVAAVGLPGCRCSAWRGELAASARPEMSWLAWLLAVAVLALATRRRRSCRVFCCRLS